MTAGTLRVIIDLATVPDPAVPDAIIGDLEQLGLVRRGGHGWQLTTCGEAFFDKLLRVPLFPLEEM